MEKIELNKCQTPIEELGLEKQPKEVQDQFWDFINNVPFIRWMISKDRPMVSELPRDEDGKAIIDITKPPILENTDYFRQTGAIYDKTGRYTTLAPNRNPQSEFGKWIREERRRGWEGYVDPSTGMWVTGDYYWSLNYCPMHLIEKKENGLEVRVVKMPRFWDGQFLVTHYFNQARLHKHHAAELASRGRGKTTIGAAMLSKRFIIGEYDNNRKEVQCLVTAADLTKLTGTNQILSVFKSNIDFCAKETQFPSMRLRSDTGGMQWKMGYKKRGSDVEYGSRNEVMGIIAGVNQDKLNGTRGVLYIIEEAGIFRDLLSTYNMIRPSVEQGSSVFGEILCYGTSGDDESDFTAFAEMIYNPDGYNMEALPNVFDKEGQGRRTMTMFYPAYMNYDDSCMDKDGNSDVTKALFKLCVDRYKVKYGSTDINTITKRISQYPIVPQEAIIRSNNNVFPVTELNDRINEIDNNPSEYDDVYVGELTIDSEGKVKFEPTNDKPIRDYPLKDNKVKGALEIYEMPQKDSEGKIPMERYLTSCLPKGELINTDRGLVPIETVTLDDRLVNKEGEFVSIINTQSRYYSGDVYEVKLDTIYRTTTFTGKHPIFCATPEVHYHNSKYAQKHNLPYQYSICNFDFRHANKLRNRDVVKVPNIYRAEKPFADKWIDTNRIDKRIPNPLDSEDFWWLFGVIAGDGWACSGGYKVYISFNRKEVCYIEKARRIAKSLFYRSFCQEKDNSAVEFSICSKTLNEFVAKNLGRGAENKSLAEWIKFLPSNLKKQLVLGYLASDGSVCCNNIEFVSVSLKLLSDFQDILYSLGIISGVTKMKSKAGSVIGKRVVKTVKDKYHLRIGGKSKYIVKSWNPNELKLKRITYSHTGKSKLKRAWFSEDYKYIYMRVKSVKRKKYSGYVYNFECNTHTYMCNYVPTHNCDPYDQDQADTMSLGSVFVLDLWTDRIVAEYTGRTMFADDLYEVVRKICLFYNCKVMIESNIKGYFGYFSKMNSLYLLAETPEYLRDRQLIGSIGIGNNAYGIKATVPIINYSIRLIRDWLLKPVNKIEKDKATGEEHEVTVPNLRFIRNRALLKELALYNPVANFDRVRSLSQLMLYREERMVMYQGNVKREEKPKGIASDSYWEKNYPGRPSERARNYVMEQMSSKSKD